MDYTIVQIGFAVAVQSCLDDLATALDLRLRFRAQIGIIAPIAPNGIFANHVLVIPVKALNILGSIPNLGLAMQVGRCLPKCSKMGGSRFWRVIMLQCFARQKFSRNAEVRYFILLDLLNVGAIACGDGIGNLKRRIVVDLAKPTYLAFVFFARMIARAPNTQHKQLFIGCRVVHQIRSILGKSKELHRVRIGIVSSCRFCHFHKYFGVFKIICHEGVSFQARSSKQDERHVLSLKLR